MREGKYPDGAKVLRAKIDMSSPNINMRDPVMYRILHSPHHRTGNKWCIYPTYDWAHGQSDSIEKITHSICTLEFENHRPLYDWFIEQLGIHHPRQIEFARLNLTHTVMSKRKLLELVNGKYVYGWDDPRMPTISGMRRRGYTPTAIRNFCSRIGVAKTESTADIALLEHFVRDDLNKKALRVMGILNPLKVVIENYPEDRIEEIDAVNNPEDPSAGTRKILFSKTLYIEKDDFMEVPPKNFYRLAPGRELHCTYDPATKGGNAPDGRKVKATLHWLSSAHAIPAEVRLYNYLFTKENPMDVPEGQDFKKNLNPSSLEILDNCYVEPSLIKAQSGTVYQFERLGYFCVDSADTNKKLVFNRTVTLKDRWGKIQEKNTDR